MPTRTWISAVMLGLAACSTPATSMVEIRDQPERALVLEAFPGAGKLLSGFDEGRGDVPLGTGERALFGLELDNAGDVRRWLVLAEVEAAPGPPRKDKIVDMDRLTRQTFRTPAGHRFTYESRNWPMRVTLFDAAGKQLGSSTVVVPWDFLTGGFIRSCDLTRMLMASNNRLLDYAGRKITRKEAAREIYGGFAALSAFLQLVQNNELLADVLWQVIDRPSLFSVVFQGGVHLYIRSVLSAARTDVGASMGSGRGEDLQKPRKADRILATMAAPSRLRSYKVPLEVKANDTPVLHATMRVTDPESPLRVCGGILSLSGYRPSDPRVRFRLEVLAARRLAAEGGRLPE